jgi:glycosyltransferase involved in cell wall biosynthesis
MKDISPKISVIVPVYKVEQYLSKCIESILNQSFTDFELLLIDDGSPDNSGKICDEYAFKDKRITVFHKQNEGVSSSRNLGIENAVGEWICFVDSDDWIEKDAFQEIICSIEERKVDLVIWGYKLVYPKYSREINVPYSGFFSLKSEIDDLLIKCDLQKLLESTCNKLYSTNIIKKNSIRFDPKMSLMEDSKFNWIYFDFVKSVFSIQQSFYNYRLNHNKTSLSTTYSANFLEIRNENVNRRFDFFSGYKGKYKNQYQNFLYKDIEMAHLELTLMLYNNNSSFRKRSESIKQLINREKIDLLKSGSIYSILKIKNVFIIDIMLKTRFLITKNIPVIFRIFQKFRPEVA